MTGERRGRDESGAGAAARRARLRACAAATVESSLVVARGVRAEVRRQLPGASTLLEARALAYVERHRSCSPSEVAAYLALSAPAATKLLEPLVVAGLLSRATATGDRRRRALALTPAGRTRLNDVRRVTRAWAESRLAALGDGELAEIERAMATLERLFSGADVDE